MEAGISEGPVFGDWQHCHGAIRHMVVVHVA
jgi:hypothetical protein